jgi:hypothetical protein
LESIPERRRPRRTIPASDDIEGCLCFFCRREFADAEIQASAEIERLPQPSHARAPLSAGLQAIRQAIADAVDGRLYLPPAGHA